MSVTQLPSARSHPLDGVRRERLCITDVKVTLLSKYRPNKRGMVSMVKDFELDVRLVLGALRCRCAVLARHRRRTDGSGRGQGERVLKRGDSTVGGPSFLTQVAVAPEVLERGRVGVRYG